MNEQTKSLAMQYAHKMGNSVLYNAEYMEEFAQLIVGECVAKIRKGTENTVQYDLAYNAMLTAIIADIQESFGVE
jgi:hypothetical protein